MQLKPASRKHAALTYICGDFLNDQSVQALHLGRSTQQVTLQVRQMQPLPAEQPLLQLGVAVGVGVSKLIHLLGPAWEQTSWSVLASRRRLWGSVRGREGDRLSFCNFWQPGASVP